MGYFLVKEEAKLHFSISVQNRDSAREGEGVTDKFYQVFYHQQNQGQGKTLGGG